MNPDQKAIADEVTKRALDTNLNIAATFAETGDDYMGKLQEMVEDPKKLELFQLQCMSMGTWCSVVSGEFGDNMAKVYAKAGTGAAHLVETLRLKNKLAKGNKGN